MTNDIRITTKAGVRGHSRSATDVPAPGKKGIDRQQVLNAARELSNEHGVGELSIKAVADRLGIRPPSLYAHFDGLTEIRKELAHWGHRLLAQRLRDSAVALTGANGVIAAAKAYLAFVRDEPGLYSATVAPGAMSEPDSRDAAREWIGVLQRLLESMGLDHDDRIHALRGIRSMVHGFGQLEAGGQFRTEVDRDTSFDRMLRTFVEALSSPSQAFTQSAK
ncbi:TetR/AcrR family transcriptional regulator [uncultured Hydrogenophaga sp.]|uniref:TetR/AcrR family transcriptional regulator n=1 Tax=uncultured Hydrogenophaga sp. TaxID=199683 RepID=UPI002587D432|nr:TetR/AcrR family transcriptional regulator [uncultured Hydrogenophaga sp.]